MKAIYYKRTLLCLAGITLTCVASAIFYLTGLGSDPYQVFAIAVHKRLGITYGQANMLLNFCIFLFFWFFKRSYIHIAMFLSVFYAGPCIDVLKQFLGLFLGPQLPAGVRALFGVLGCVILAFGCFLYLLSDLGASPADGVGLFISEQIRVPYDRVRIFTDLFFAGVGAALGGMIGITTVFAVVLTGPCIGIFKRAFSGYVSPFLKNENR